MSVLPTFSAGGWVTNPLEQVDYMVAYFFETQKSQSHFHKGVVTSYQFLLAQANSMGELGSSIEISFGDFMKSQFDAVQLECRVDGAFGDPDNNELVVTIGCSFSAAGKRYTISHAIDLLGTNVKKIRRLDETGSTA